MSDNRTQPTELDAFFEALQTNDSKPGADLLARIEAQALDEMPAKAVDTQFVAPADVQGQNPGLFQRALDMLGGWTGAGGLATACALGVVIGLNATSGLVTLSDTETASYSSYGIGLVDEFETALLLE